MGEVSWEERAQEEVSRSVQREGKQYEIAHRSHSSKHARECQGVADTQT